MIELRGAYGQGNFGDDALMVVAYAIINEVLPGRQIGVRSKESTYLPRLLPNALMLTGADGELDAGSDTVVYGGGTQWFSFRRHAPFLDRLYKSGKRRIGLARDSLTRSTRHRLDETARRTFGLGVGVGPFLKGSSAREQAEGLFRTMQYAGVRDPYSFNLCRAWMGERARLRADLCYLPGHWTLPDISPSAHKRDGINEVGVVVRDWPHTKEGDSYAKPLLGAAELLRASGKKVEFVSFCRRSDSGWHRLLQERGEAVETWEPDTTTIPAFLDRLARFDALISARYHGAVFASLLGLPVVCVEIEQKLRLASESLGLGARLWQYPFRTGDLLKSIDSLDSAYDSAVTSLSRAVRDQGALVRRLVKEFGTSANPTGSDRVVRLGH